jgi:GT2 family glycosyltransferase
MKLNFTIGIPTLNRKDLLVPALLYYQMDFPDTRIMILDNGRQSIEIPGLIDNSNNLLIYSSKKNLGVSASWNHLIIKSFEDPHINFVAILNDDIYWGVDQETLRVILYQHCLQGSDFILLPKGDKYDMSVFVISRGAWLKVGHFDMNFFPAYFEDKDYLYRAKIAGISIYRTLPDPARFVTSGTIEKNKGLLERRELNLEYYVKKWGGQPGDEKYTISFNENI